VADSTMVAIACSDWLYCSVFVRAWHFPIIICGLIGTLLESRGLGYIEKVSAHAIFPKDS